MNDPSDYDRIYSMSSKFYKDPLFYDALGLEVMFTSINNDLHRYRRAPLNNFFSRRAVFDLEDIVQEKTRKLCERVQQSFDSGKPVDIRAGTRAISIDVATEYAFNDCWNHLDAEDFNAWFSDAVYDTGVMWWNFQQFPFLLGPMRAIPEDYARKMSPAMNGWMDCIVKTREYVAKVNGLFKAGIKPQRRSIFHELLDPLAAESQAPTPSVERLEGEALSLCTAAADTTGNSMEMAAYQVVTKPRVYAELRKELINAFPNPSDQLDFATLEKLPYLTGVVKEGQRLSYGVISRLARATPEGGATFHGHYIPAGVSIIPHHF
jgi:cytochrome P450